MPAARRLARTPGSCTRTSPETRCSRTTISNAGISESWSCMPIHTAVPSVSSSRTESRLVADVPAASTASSRPPWSATAASSSSGRARRRRRSTPTWSRRPASMSLTAIQPVPIRRSVCAISTPIVPAPNTTAELGAERPARAARVHAGGQRLGEHGEHRVDALRQHVHAAQRHRQLLAEAARARSADHLAVLADVLAPRPAGAAQPARHLRIDGDRRGRPATRARLRRRRPPRPPARAP